MLIITFFFTIFRFQNLLNMKYSQSLYPDSFNIISKLLQCNEENGFHVDLNDCNVPLYVLACSGLISFRTKIPNQIIVLDSGNSMDDDAYTKMLKRYCEILHYSNSDSKFVCTPGNLLTTVDDSTSTIETNKRPASDEIETEESVKRLKLAIGEPESCDTEKNTEESKDGDMKRGGGSGSWRVVLYMMREEAKKEINNFTGNRAQEFFVVNASKVQCSKMDGLELYAKDMDSKVVSALIRNIIG